MPNGSARYFYSNGDEYGVYHSEDNTEGVLTFSPAEGGVYIDPMDGVTYKFDSQGRLLRVINRNGWITRYDYNSRGQVERATDPFGRSLVFHYAIDTGLLTSVQTPDGAIRYGYDNVRRLVFVTYPDNKTKKYIYENEKYRNLITGVDDEAERRLAIYAYDDFGRAIESQLVGGVDKFSISYIQDRPAGGAQYGANIIDALGTRRSYIFSNANGKLAISGGAYQSAPSDKSISPIAIRAQDAKGNIVSEIDFRGTRTETIWDTARRLPTREVKVANRTGEAQTTWTDWHPTLRLPVKITETGAQGGSRITDYTYDSRGNRLSETVSGTGLATATRSWTYTAQSLVATETDESGGITTHSYDTWGNRTSTTDPLGKTSTYTHDGAGRVLTSTTDGITTANTYDLRGRLLTQSAGGLTTVMTYLPTGLLHTLTQPNGYKLTYSYDAAHRLTGWSDNRGNSGQYTLDGMGNRTAEQTKDNTGAVAFQLSRTINAINRVASETVGGSQNVNYQYDANGDLIGQTNALGQSSNYTLDGLRRLTNEKNPLNANATLGYNALDAVTQAKDFKGVITSYTRDAQGNATQEASPDIGTETNSFDPRGLAANSQDAAGRTQTITRDALGRPTGISHGDGANNAASSFVYE